MNSYAWYIGAVFGFLSLVICLGSLIYCCLKWNKRNNNSASKRVKRDRNNEIHINSDSNTIDHVDTGKTKRDRNNEIHINSDNAIDHDDAGKTAEELAARSQVYMNQIQILSNNKKSEKDNKKGENDLYNLALDDAFKSEKYNKKKLNKHLQKLAADEDTSYDGPSFEMDQLEIISSIKKTEKGLNDALDQMTDMLDTDENVALDANSLEQMKLKGEMKTFFKWTDHQMNKFIELKKEENKKKRESQME